MVEFMYFGGFPDENMHGLSCLKWQIINYVFPEDWMSGEEHAKQVSHVVKEYLETPVEDDQERLKHARLEVADRLGKCERTVRNALGPRLYDEEGGSKYRFEQDLKEIETIWREEVENMN